MKIVHIGLLLSFIAMSVTSIAMPLIPSMLLFWSSMSSIVLFFGLFAFMVISETKNLNCG